jgi:hypothetical protein
MRIDVGSIIAVLKTAYIGYGHHSDDSVVVEHDGKAIDLDDYVRLLEAAHASPVQSILMDATVEQVRVVRHEAGE